MVRKQREEWRVSSRGRFGIEIRGGTDEVGELGRSVRGEAVLGLTLSVNVASVNGVPNCQS